MKYTIIGRNGERIDTSDNRTREEADREMPAVAKSWGAKVVVMRDDNKRK